GELQWCHLQEDDKVEQLCANASWKFPRKFLWAETPMLAKEHNLCATGPALKEALNRYPGLGRFLEHFRVLARMTPDLKEEVAAALIESGRTVLMCGDGSNDVGALKKSHVGLALLSGFGDVNTDTPSGKSNVKSGDKDSSFGIGGKEKAEEEEEQSGPGLKKKSAKEIRDAAKTLLQRELEELMQDHKSKGELPPIKSVFQVIKASNHREADAR
ncbi:unnamed protein product, partial [Choristocarpus tenellus]